jgi:hypothetical protein
MKCHDQIPIQSNILNDQYESFLHEEWDAKGKEREKIVIQIFAYNDFKFIIICTANVCPAQANAAKATIIEDKCRILICFNFLQDRELIDEVEFNYFFSWGGIYIPFN